jgi:hypothetical protein
MHWKPDWFKSRTFWIAAVSGVVAVLSAGGMTDLGAQITEYADLLLPTIFAIVGITERKNAAPVDAE